MRYLFGPVPSRRFGYSLGVDIIPHKLCTLDCQYCQLGPTTDKTVTRKAYVGPGPVLAEIDDLLTRDTHVDCITFAGSGEPTLNSRLGQIIAGIKTRCALPIIVLTNGSLLDRPDVRRDIGKADIICPSFDAATPEAFAGINRPHADVCLAAMIRGLQQLRQEFTGKIYLEVMLVRGVNDSAHELKALAKVLPEFGADRIHINTVIRPAAAPGIWAVSPATLEQARRLFGPTSDIIGGFVKEHSVHEQENTADRIVELVRRHPGTAADICAALGLTTELTDDYLGQLLLQGRIRKTIQGGSTFYTP